VIDLLEMVALYWSDDMGTKIEAAPGGLYHH